MVEKMVEKTDSVKVITKKEAREKPEFCRFNCGTKIYVTKLECGKPKFYTYLNDIEHRCFFEKPFECRRINKNTGEVCGSNVQKLMFGDGSFKYINVGDQKAKRHDCTIPFVPKKKICKKDKDTGPKESYIAKQERMYNELKERECKEEYKEEEYKKEECKENDITTKNKSKMCMKNPNSKINNNKNVVDNKSAYQNTINKKQDYGKKEYGKKDYHKPKEPTYYCEACDQNVSARMERVCKWCNVVLHFNDNQNYGSKIMCDGQTYPAVCDCRYNKRR